MVSIASDHAGFKLKELIKNYLLEKGYDIKDFGTSSSEESVDYPDFAEKVAKSVSLKESEFGVLCCGSGIGMSIAANKIPGIRAALCNDLYSAKMSREHNDANIMCIGQNIVDEKNALLIVEEFSNTKFSGGRHVRRIEKIKEIETRKNNE